MSELYVIKDRRIRLSVVEVFVFVVVLAVCALLIPLIQQMRESARMEECADRIRQCLAAQHRYHDASKRLAPASLVGDQLMSSTARLHVDHQWTSALMLVAPYMDLPSIASQLPPIAFDIYTLLSEYPALDSPNFAWPGEIPKAAQVLNSRVPVFECPSDYINEIEFVHFIGIDMSLAAYVPTLRQGVNDDKNWRGFLVYFGDAAQRVFRTNFAPCIGAHGHIVGPEREKWRGCMSPRKKFTFDMIQDGTSRTMMFGENIGGIFNGVRGIDLDDDNPSRTEAGWAWSWAWGGGVQVRGNIPYNQGELTSPIHGHDDQNVRGAYVDPESIAMLGNDKFSPTRGFGAMHTNGVNIGLADGATRNLDRVIDWKVLYELAGARDSPNHI